MINNVMHNLGTAPSIIRELFAYGLQQAQIVGPDKVYDYTLGNPSVPAPAKVNQAIKEILEDTPSIAIHGYSMAGGFPETKSAIATDLTERFGLNIGPGDIFITCGAAPALISAIKALLVDHNSEVMAIAPYFPEYKPFVESNGGKFTVVPADKENFQINMKQLEVLINENTQAIIINSPNNPSGVVYTEETLKTLAEILERKSKKYGHPIYIISDEPYRELVYGDVKVPFIPNIYSNTIISYSYSKSLSLPGERIGYVCVPPCCENAADVMAAVSGAARSMGHVCAPTLMQKVIERCASERPDLKAYEENRELLYNALTEMGYKCAKPDGAFYLFVQCPGGDGMAFCEKAKKKHNLLVVPGEGFECSGYMRLSYCVDGEMIKRSLPAFKAMIEEY